VTVLVLVVAFLALLVLGVPVAVGMGVAGAVAVWVGTNLPVVVVGQRMLVILDSFPFLALPFFIAAGLFMERGGITQRLIDFSGLLVGRLTGGLAHVLIGTNLIMAGASGSATADCAATGTVLIPALERAGYSRAFACALTAAASTVGPIIPPSIMFVLFGAIANVSIGRLFLGGAVPGLLMGLYLMVTAYLISRRRGYPRLPPVSLPAALRITRGALPAVLMPVVVLGGIVGGVFTPTEAGAIAAGYALVLSVAVYRELRISEVPRVLADTGVITGAIMLIVSAAALFGWLLARERAPELLTRGFTALSDDPQVFLLVANLALFVLGCFFEAVSLLILMTPVLMPVVTSLGIDPVHFGVVMTLNLMIGLLTPPVGMNMYIVCAIGSISIREYTREAMPLIAALLLVLFLITYVPGLVLWLPNLLLGAAR
jgi:C4-dicarboxylate transporter DctM subunit